MPVHHITDSGSLLSPTLRTPSVTDATGGAISESEAVERGMPGASLGVAVRMEMMPTPQAMEGYHGNNLSSDYRLSQNRQVMLSNIVVDIAAEVTLLPTPTTRDFKDGSAEHERDGVVQTDTVARAVFNSGEVALLGTVRTSSANAATQKQIDADAPKSRLEDQVHVTSWGKFAPAIERWERITRVAPAPTKPDGKDGAHRLSAEFTEWMMGLPEGWVTSPDIGLKRNEQLKACGNGVVPQQAVLALRMLLEDVDL